MKNFLMLKLATSIDRIKALYPNVTQDKEFRINELKKKLEEYNSEEDKAKAYADIIMALQWADLAGADTSGIDIPSGNNSSVESRLAQLEDRLARTGSLYR